MKLTKTAIDELSFAGGKPGAKDVRWDDQVRGFGVRVWPSGKKTFVFKYRVNGRQRYLTLGDYGTLTPTQARELATQRRGDVLRGIDPLAEKQKAARGETMADLAKAYIERHARPHNKRWADDVARLDLYVLPDLGTTKVSNISRRDIAQLHHKIGAQKNSGGHAKTTTANRVLSLLSSMFNQAIVWGYLDDGALNPTRLIRRFPEVKRDRFVSRDEMPRLVSAIDAEQNVFIQALIWLYLFTGMRKSELQTLTWESVDLARPEIRLADTKAGRPLYLPLSSPATFVLERIPKMRNNPYVFCGQRHGRHLVNVSKAWLRIRKAAGLNDVRLHDLRRTVGSWVAQSGASLALIGKILNHSNVSTTQVYARFDQELVAATLETHGVEVMEIGRPQLGPPVPPDFDRASATDSSEVD